MEITELNLIGDFQAGIKCLQNPSFFSGFSPLAGVLQLYSFWTWGALILAVFAAFSSVFNRIRLFLYRIRIGFLVSCQKSCADTVYDDDDFDFDFSDDDDTPSSVAESDDEGCDSEDGGRPAGEVFRAEGTSCWGRGESGGFSLRRRNGFSWSDFSAGKSVVQLWDSFGLGLDFEDDDSDEDSDSEYGSGVAIWDLDRNMKISSGRRCDVPPAAAAASVVLTAEMNRHDGGVALGAYDARVDGKAPAVYAAWRPRQRKVAGRQNAAAVDREMRWDAGGA